MRESLQNRDFNFKYFHNFVDIFKHIWSDYLLHDKNTKESQKLFLK